MKNDDVTEVFKDEFRLLTQLHHPNLAAVYEFGRCDEFEGVYHEVDASAGGYIFEPDANTVLENILPHYINYQLFQMMLEARASEHSARMVAMKAATDNADQLVKDLTLEYNKVRQAAITSELLEITTAMKALE